MTQDPWSLVSLCVLTQQVSIVGKDWKKISEAIATHPLWKVAATPEACAEKYHQLLMESGLQHASMSGSPSTLLYQKLNEKRISELKQRLTDNELALRALTAAKQQSAKELMSAVVVPPMDVAVVPPMDVAFQPNIEHVAVKEESSQPTAEPIVDHSNSRPVIPIANSYPGEDPMNDLDEPSVDEMDIDEAFIEPVSAVCSPILESIPPKTPDIKMQSPSITPMKSLSPINQPSTILPPFTDSLSPNHSMTSRPTSQLDIFPTPLTSLCSPKEQSLQELPPIEEENVMSDETESVRPYSPVTETEMEEKKLSKEDEERRRNFKRTCMTLWEKIADHRFGPLFTQLPKESRTVDYERAIRYPSSLMTVKNRIKDGDIKTFGEFCRDVILVFTNAIMYHPIGSEIHDMALEIKEFAESEFRTLWLTDTKVMTRRKSVANDDIFQIEPNETDFNLYF